MSTNTLIIIALVVLFLLALGGGRWGSSRYGGWSWSPVFIILAVAVVLYLTGHLRIG